MFGPNTRVSGPTLSVTMYGGQSWRIFAAPPTMACVPMRQNWCTPDMPPTIAKSSTTTSPASAAAFDMITSLPTEHPWATWQ
jgi:hypothetical protein